VNEVAGEGDAADDEDDLSEDDDGATPSVLGAEPVANDVNAVGQEEPEDSDAASEGQAVVCSEDEYPIELRCELCNAEVALSQAYSVNAVTPVVKQRLKSAQSARSAFTKGGNDSGKWSRKEKETIQEIKNRTVCSVCGASGHWHEDPDCPSYEKTVREKSAMRRPPKAGGHSRAPGRNKTSKTQGGLGKSALNGSSKSRKPFIANACAGVGAPRGEAPHQVGAVSSVSQVLNVQDVSGRQSDAKIAAQLNYFRWKQPHGCATVSHVTNVSSVASPHLSTSRKIEGPISVHRVCMLSVNLTDDEGEGDSDGDYEIGAMHRSSKWMHAAAKPMIISLEQVDHIYAVVAPTDRGLTVLETACAMSVSSDHWLGNCDENLYGVSGLSAMIVEEHEHFAFGNCESQLSERYWRLPGCVDGVGAAVVGTSELPGYFPMLCSLNQQGSLGIKIDTETKTADVRAFALYDRPLRRSSAGHLAINLLDSWNDDMTELC